MKRVYDEEVAICKALGLDNTRVSGLSLNLRAGHFPEVLVVIEPTPGQLGDLAEVLQRFNLVPKEPA